MALIPLAARKQPEAPAIVARTQTVPSLPVPPTNQTLLVQYPDNNPNAAGNLFPESRLPPTIRGFEVQGNEYVNWTAGAVAQNVINLEVCLDYHQRYIYALLNTNPSVATNYYILCDVTLWKGFSPVGSFPLIDAIGPTASSVLPRTLLGAFAGGGNVIDSSMVVFLQAPNSGENSQYTLQPQYFECDIDKITVSVREFKNVTGFRIYCACKSVARFSPYRNP